MELLEDRRFNFKINKDIDPTHERWQRTYIRAMLRKWYYFDHHINDFTDSQQLTNIKSFYYRLSYLTDEERAKLAYIYYYANRYDRPTASEVEAKYNLSKVKAINMKNELIDKISIPRVTPKDDANTDAKIKARNKRIKQALQSLLPEDKRD